MSIPREERNAIPTHALVKTAAGNSFVPMDGHVWVQVGSQVLKKSVRDLQPGDDVFEKAPSIDISLADIKQALLEKDETYRTAHLLLHVPSEEGREVPKLQAFLADVAKVSIGDLANPKTRKAAVLAIKNRLESLTKKFEKRKSTNTLSVLRSESAIQDWLSGKTVLPEDMLTLKALRKLDRISFDRMFGVPSKISVPKGGQIQDYPLVWAHQHWTATHQVLRRWVSGFSDKALSSDSQTIHIPVGKLEGQRANSRSFEKERDIVFDQCIKPTYTPVTFEHGFIRVKEVTWHTKESESGSTANKGAHLGRGIALADKTDIFGLKPELTETNFRDLARQETAANYLIGKILERLSIETTNGNVTGKGHLVCRMLTRQKESLPSPDETVKFTGEVHELSDTITMNRKQVEGLFNQIHHKSQSGELDGENGLTPGTFSRLLTWFRQTHHAAYPVAKALFEFKQSIYPFFQRFSLMGREERRNEKKRIENLVRNVRKYGVEPGGVPTPQDLTEHIHVEQKIKYRQQSMGVDFWKSEAPLSREELEKMLRSHVDEKDIPKLIELFGSGKLVE